MNNTSALQEAKRHGTFSFPFEFYPCSIPESFTTLVPHWHEELEMTVIQEGMCQYHIDLSTYQVKAGDLILLSPHLLHGISRFGGCTMSSDSFVFNLRMLCGNYPELCTTKYLTPLSEQKYRFPVVIKKDEKNASALAETLNHLKFCYQKQRPGFELEIKASLYHLLALLFESAPCETKVPEQTEITEKIKSVLKYIRTNYRQAISISELASICHFSDYYFMRFFRRYMNMTCIEYINSYRLSKAMEQLETTRNPITEIALENGFNNLSYFNKLFKRQFGMTPGEHRKSKPRQ